MPLYSAKPISIPRPGSTLKERPEPVRSSATLTPLSGPSASVRRRAPPSWLTSPTRSSNAARVHCCPKRWAIDAMLSCISVPRRGPTGRGPSADGGGVTSPALSGNIDVELVLDAHARVAEGPVWDDRTGTLVWVDIMSHQVHRYDPAKDRDQAIDVGQPVGAAVLRQDGDGLMVALQNGFGLLGEATERVELVAPVEQDVPTNRMNDGTCDPAGRF